jgi:hypothetical protein
MPTSKRSEDKVISISEVTSAPRGRKKVITPALAEQLADLRAGQAVALHGTFGNVPQAKRAAVSQVIRKHWQHVRDDQCRISYSPEGVPQVFIKR